MRILQSLLFAAASSTTLLLVYLMIQEHYIQGIVPFCFGVLSPVFLSVGSTPVGNWLFGFRGGKIPNEGLRGKFVLQFNGLVHHTCLAALTRPLILQRDALHSALHLISQDKAKIDDAPFFKTYQAADFTKILSIPDEIMTSEYLIFGFLGFSLANCISLVHFERKASDFSLMLLHHVLTYMAMFSAWFLGYSGYYLVCIYVHAVTDITIDLLKCFHYLDFDYDHIQIPFLEITFIINWFAWAYYRLYLFPLLIVFPSYFSLQKEINTNNTTHYNLTTISIVALFTLLSFHVFWFAKLTRLGWRLANGKKPKQN